MHHKKSGQIFDGFSEILRDHNLSSYCGLSNQPLS